MFKLMDKKIIAILRSKFLLNWPYEAVNKQMREQMAIVMNGGKRVQKFIYESHH